MTQQQGRLAPGHPIADRYQVANLLGAGEMGEVYDVREFQSGYAYTVKLFRPEAVQSQQAWQAYCDDALKASSLGIAGVARVYDFQTEAATGMPYGLGEYVTLSTLSAWIAQHGVLSAAQATGLLQALAPVLDAVHQQGLVHRALKPTNIFVGTDAAGAWSVTVTDFGVAAARLLSPPSPGWPATPGWLSAEQADPSIPAHPTMDVYALGLVMFYALTGRSYFTACQSQSLDLNLLWAEMTAPPVAASTRAQQLGVSLSPAYDPWFARVLSVVPSERFATVAEMASAFAAIVPTQAVAAMPGQSVPVAQGVEEAQQPGQSLEAPAAAGAFVGAAAASPADTTGEWQNELAPKKSRKKLYFVLGAVAAVLVVAVVLVFVFTGGKDESKDAVAQASASAAVASAAAPETAEPPKPPAPTDALVTFACSPNCESIECGSIKVEDPKRSVRLEAGTHTCKASAQGYVTFEDKFDVKAGEDLERKISLEKEEKKETKPVAQVPATPPSTPPATRPNKSGTGNKSTSSKPSTKPSKPTKRPGQSCGTLLNPCK